MKRVIVTAAICVASIPGQFAHAQDGCKSFSGDFTAVAYVVSGFVGRPGYMSAGQVVAADRAGIEIGSHTVDHANLARQSGAGVRYEVSDRTKSQLYEALEPPLNAREVVLLDVPTFGAEAPRARLAGRQDRSPGG